MLRRNSPARRRAALQNWTPMDTWCRSELLRADDLVERLQAMVDDAYAAIEAARRAGASDQALTQLRYRIRGIRSSSSSLGRAA
jgi:hypothetical protein